MRARWLLVAVLGAAPVVQARAQDRAEREAGSLVGVVLAREGGTPLTHTVVALPRLGREMFTNDSGAFAFAGVPPGRTTLRVRRLGFTPIDVAVHVRGGVVDTIRIHISRVAVRLAAVNVQERAPCLDPGAPSASRDRDLATVYEQLMLNAEQYRTMSRAYPFAYSLVSTRSHRRRDGTVVVEAVDTSRVVTEWKYAPGQVLRLDRISPDRAMLMLLVPTLGNFADPAFVANHCFHNGGVVTVDGTRFVKIEMVAAERIATPDVSGSILLDPETFQIRRSVLRLSRLPDAPGLLDAEVVTDFHELMPSVPVIGRIRASQTFNPRKRGVRYAAGYEEQHLVNFTFLGARPGDEIRP